METNPGEEGLPIAPRACRAMAGGGGALLDLGIRELHRAGRIRPKHPCGFAGPRPLFTALKILNKLYSHLHRNRKSKFNFSVGIFILEPVYPVSSGFSIYAHTF
jgi:hypothetical protein